MANSIPALDNGVTTSHYAVFLDTSLETHLVLAVSDSDTVFDLKQKILQEHPFCFPELGDIKINALMIKLSGFFYHLPDFIIVKTVFHGVRKSWFLYVDATSLKEHQSSKNIERSPGKKKSKKNSKHSLKEHQSSLDIERSPGTKKRKKNSKHKKDLRKKEAVHDLALKEKDVSLLESDKHESQREILVLGTSLQNAFEIASHDNVTANKNINTGPSMVSNNAPDKGAGSVVQRAAILSEGAGVQGEQVKRKIDEFRDDVEYDKSVEDDSQSEPVVKKKVKIGEENKGGEELLKENKTLISGSHVETLEPSTMSQKSTDCISEGSLVQTPENFLLQREAQSNENRKKRKKKRKSSNNPSEEIAAVPSYGTLSRNESLADPKDFSKEVVPGKHLQVVIGSETDAFSLNEKHREDSVEEGIKRPYSQAESSELGIINTNTGNLESRHDASGSEVASYTKSIRVSEDHLANNIEYGLNLEVQESDKVEEEQDLQNFPPKPSEMYKPSDQDEPDLETSETVNPAKSSKKRKRSKNTKAPLTSVTEHTKGSVSDLSQIEPHQGSNEDHPGDNVNKEESIIPPKEGAGVSEIEKISTPSLATDKEINDVIKNAVEFAQQIEKGQMDAENVEGKSRKKKKKLRTDARYVPETEKGNEVFSCNVATLSVDNTSAIENLSKEITQGTLANKNSLNEFNESNLEGEKGSRSENGSVHIVENGVDGDITIKKKKKKKKHDKHSHAPSADLQSSMMSNEKHEFAAKTSSLELQGSESEKISLQAGKEPLQVPDSELKSPPSTKSKKLNSVPEEAGRSSAVNPPGIVTRSKTKMAAPNSRVRSTENTGSLNTRINGRQSVEDPNLMAGRNTSTNDSGEVVNSSKHTKSLIRESCSIFKDDSEGHSPEKYDSSDASTRTPSDNSLSSDYSDGEESNADFNLSQKIDAGMTLDMILRSSSRYKKAKLTASQSQQEEDSESQPLDFVPDSQANT